MADNAATAGDAAVGDAAAAVAKLWLDEVTGEKVSKSELKKRQKQREKEAAKKEKEAAKGPAPDAAKAGKKNAEAAEKELTPNQVSLLPCDGGIYLVVANKQCVQYFEIRSRTVNELHNQGKAYPHKVPYTLFSQRVVGC